MNSSLVPCLGLQHDWCWADCLRLESFIAIYSNAGTFNILFAESGLLAPCVLGWMIKRNIWNFGGTEFRLHGLPAVLRAWPRIKKTFLTRRRLVMRPISFRTMWIHWGFWSSLSTFNISKFHLWSPHSQYFDQGCSQHAGYKRWKIHGRKSHNFPPLYKTAL